MKTEMASTAGLYHKNVLYGSPVNKYRWMANFDLTIEHFHNYSI